MYSTTAPQGRIFAFFLTLAISSIPVSSQEVDPGLKASDQKSTNLLLRIEHPIPLRHLAVSPNGRFLTGTDDKRNLVVWDLSSGKVKYRIENVGFGQFSSVGGLLSATNGDSLCQWDASTGKPVSNLNAMGALIGFSAREKEFVTTRNGTIQVRNVRSGDLVREFRPHKRDFAGPPYAMDASGSLVASSDILSGEVKILEVNSGKERCSFGGHAGRITTVAFSPKGDIAATATTNKTVHFWSLSSGKEIRKVAVAWSPLKIAFDPHGTKLAIGFSGNFDQISVLDVATGEDRPIQMKRGTSYLAVTSALCFTPQGTHLAAATGRYVQVWEISTKKGGLKKGVPDAEKR